MRNRILIGTMTPIPHYNCVIIRVYLVEYWVLQCVSYREGMNGDMKWEAMVLHHHLPHLGHIGWNLVFTMRPIMIRSEFKWISIRPEIISDCRKLRDLYSFEFTEVSWVILWAGLPWWSHRGKIIKLQVYPVKCRLGMEVLPTHVPRSNGTLLE